MFTLLCLFRKLICTLFFLFVTLLKAMFTLFFLTSYPLEVKKEEEGWEGSFSLKKKNQHCLWFLMPLGSCLRDKVRCLPEIRRLRRGRKQQVAAVRSRPTAVWWERQRKRTKKKKRERVFDFVLRGFPVISWFDEGSLDKWHPQYLLCENTIKL